MYRGGYPQRNPFFFGAPFVGGVLGGLLGSALLPPRPYYPPRPYPYPFYPGYGYGYGIGRPPYYW